MERLRWVLRMIGVIVIFFSDFNCQASFGFKESDGFLSYTSEHGRHFLCISKEVMGKEMLFVTRLTGNAFGYDVHGAGRYLLKPSIPPVVFNFEEINGKILMRYVRPDIPSDDKSEIASAIRMNNLAPVFFVFQIASRDIEKGSVSIDVSNLFSSSLPWIAISSKFGISSSAVLHSFVHSVRSSKERLEIEQLVTFPATNVPQNPTSVITLNFTHAIILLPEIPMSSRVNIGFTGFNTIRRIDSMYDLKRPKAFIQRWRLVPSDWVAYERGELVRPETPIIFYIDPNIPIKWRQYVRLGIEDWNRAFEKAGFKDAIQVVQIASGADDWQTASMRAVVRLVPGSKVAFASVVYDPRTGEILECSIQFGHDKIESMADRFFIQTAASNIAVRGGVPDSIKGALIKDLLSHEVGHVLGLTHHMGANKAYPVDSLRSPTFTMTNGLSPSIMDYTCGNYVAQPGDSVENFNGGIGELDEWSIGYGYRAIKHAHDPSDELHFLDVWHKTKKYHLEQEAAVDVDYELGDNSFSSATLGLKNLKTVMSNFDEWVSGDQIKVDALYQRALEHYETLVTSVSSKLEGYDPKEASYQLEALQLQFLLEELFETPVWLVSSQFGQGALDNVIALQGKILRRLVLYAFANRVRAGDGIQIVRLLVLLEQGIFDEIYLGQKIDRGRRHLQDAFVTSLIAVYNNELYEGFRSSDYQAMATSVLTDLHSSIEEGVSLQDDALSIIHLKSLLLRLRKAIDYH